MKGLFQPCCVTGSRMEQFRSDNRKETMIRAILVLLATVTLCDAQVYYNGYQRRNGTWVQPHWQSSPDGIRSNNWNRYPNINPFTGRPGTLRTMPLVPRTRTYNPYLGY
jgi:hypothetical protein